jgi:putative transposase
MQKRQGKRHTPEQIIKKLREADLMLASGKTIGQLCQALEISEQTFHRWRNQYGGMKAEEARRLPFLLTKRASSSCCCGRDKSYRSRGDGTPRYAGSLESPRPRSPETPRRSRNEPCSCARKRPPRTTRATTAPAAFAGAAAAGRPFRCRNRQGSEKDPSARRHRAGNRRDDWAATNPVTTAETDNSDAATTRETCVTSLPQR